MVVDCGGLLFRIEANSDLLSLLELIRSFGNSLGMVRLLVYL